MKEKKKNETKEKLIEVKLPKQIGKTVLMTRLAINWDGKL